MLTDLPPLPNRIDTMPTLPITRVFLYKHGVGMPETGTAAGVVRTGLVSVLTDAGDLHSYDLHDLAGLQLRDAHLRRDLDYYLRTQLASKKKEARTFTFFATGQGRRTVRLS